MTTARQFGSSPTTAERLDRALELIAALSLRIEALEEKAGVEDEDARSPARPSPPEWLPFPAAVKVTGFSASGLRRRIKHHSGARWWRWYAGKLFVHVPTAPHR